MKEVEDSSLVDHTSTLLFSESLILLLSEFLIPKKVVRGRRFPPHAHLLLSEFSPSLVVPTIMTTRAHIL